MASLAPRGILAQGAKRGFRDQRAILASLALMALKVSQDPKESRAIQDRKATKGTRARKEPLAQPVALEQLALQVQRVQLDPEVSLEILALAARQVRWVLRGFLGRKEILDLQAPQAQPAQCQDPKVRSGQREMLALQAPSDLKAQQASPSASKPTSAQPTPRVRSQWSTPHHSQKSQASKPRHQYPLTKSGP